MKGVNIFSEENVLKLDSGDGCKALSIYVVFFKILDCNFKRAHFVMCELCLNETLVLEIYTHKHTHTNLPKNAIQGTCLT